MRVDRPDHGEPALIPQPSTVNQRPAGTASRIAAGLALLALAYFLYRVRDTLPPFLIAFAVAVLLDPVLDRMQRWGWSRRAATLVVFAVFLLIFAAVALILIPAAVRQAADFVGNLPSYYSELMTRAQTALRSQHTLLARLHLPTSSTEILAKYQAEIAHLLQVLLSRLLQFFAGSVSKLVWVVIIPIVTFYLLQDIDPLRARVVHLVPTQHRSRFLEMAERVGAVFSGYVRGLIIVCAGYAVVNGLVLGLAFRLPYALMIAMVSGVLYAVPYIGAIVTIAVGGLVAVATDHSTGFVLGVVGSLVLINQAFDQIVTPRIVGGLVGLHPVVSLFALTAGAQLFGLPGMILAVPVAASLQVVLTSLWPQLAAPLPEASPASTGGKSRRRRKHQPPPAAASSPGSQVQEEAGSGKAELPVRDTEPAKPWLRGKRKQ